MLGASPRRCDGRNDAPVTRRHWTPRLPAPFAAACCRPLWPRTELRVLLSLQGKVSSSLHQLLAPMVATSCQRQPGRVSIPLAGVSSWQTPGCSQGGGKAAGRVSQAREIENRGKSPRSQAGSGGSPGQCPGRERCRRKAGRGKAMFPYASPAAPPWTRMYPLRCRCQSTGREGGRGSAQRR